MYRKIIQIDPDKCDGCGLCMPNCPEGAIQIIDGKARLVSDLFCDGLGACIGHCPKGAISITGREAQAYSEPNVMERIVKQGKNVILAHLNHLKEHNEEGLLKQALEFLKNNHIALPSEFTKEKQKLPCGCPGTNIMQFNPKKAQPDSDGNIGKPIRQSELGNWPVQLKLVPAVAGFLGHADILIAADCVPFAYASFHEELLRGKVLLVGCPKLDDINLYKEKLSGILQVNDIKSITYAHMEVPCCFGLVETIKTAIGECGRQVPFQEIIIGVKGGRLK